MHSRTVPTQCISIACRAFWTHVHTIQSGKVNVAIGAQKTFLFLRTAKFVPLQFKSWLVHDVVPVIGETLEGNSIYASDGFPVGTKIMTVHWLVIMFDIPYGCDSVRMTPRTLIGVLPVLLNDPLDLFHLSPLIRPSEWFWQVIVIAIPKWVY